MRSFSTLLIRADATNRIGTGHAMRSIALAQAWQVAGGAVVLAMAPGATALHARLVAENITVYVLDGIEPGSTADAAWTASLADTLGARWVIADGYHFGSAFQHTIVEAGLRLLIVDDYGHAQYYAADLVLNQNLYANASYYEQRKASTRLLLGPYYTLLRKEFLQWQTWQRTIPPVARRILVTFGGSDPDNVTLCAIEALQLLAAAKLDVCVVVGAANDSRAQLEEAVERSPVAIKLLTAVQDMPTLMAWADLAVTSTGSTCWELAFMGVPIVGTILAENQRYIAESLAEAGIAINAGWHTELATEQLANIIISLHTAAPTRRQMSEQGRAIFDGGGAQRVIDTMCEIEQGTLVL